MARHRNATPDRAYTLPHKFNGEDFKNTKGYTPAETTKQQPRWRIDLGCVCICRHDQAFCPSDGAVSMMTSRLDGFNGFALDRGRGHRVVNRASNKANHTSESPPPLPRRYSNQQTRLENTAQNPLRFAKRRCVYACVRDPDPKYIPTSTVGTRFVPWQPTDAAAPSRETEASQACSLSTARGGQTDSSSQQEDSETNSMAAGCRPPAARPSCAPLIIPGPASWSECDPSS